MEMWEETSRALYIVLGSNFSGRCKVVKRETKLVKGLEEMLWRRLRRDFIGLYILLRMGCGDGCADLFSLISSDGMCGNGSGKVLTEP